MCVGLLSDKMISLAITLPLAIYAFSLSPMYSVILLLMSFAAYYIYRLYMDVVNSYDVEDDEDDEEEDEEEPNSDDEDFIDDDEEEEDDEDDEEEDDEEIDEEEVKDLTDNSN